MEISKVIIPAAGLDSRFLPFSKSVPKEMLPILSKPAIQWITEEAYRSELSNLFVVIGKNKDIIVDYFNNSFDSNLKESNEVLTDFAKILRHLQLNYIRQAEPLGLGHAISMARSSIHKEYFAIALPDDIICSKQPTLSQLIRVARQEKASVIAVQEVPTELSSYYGMVAIKKQITPSLYQLSHIVEKPHAKDAPSNLAVVGRYILSHKIFNSLDYVSTYACEQLELTDAISHMMHNNERVFAFKIPGIRYDIGTPLGWIKSVIGMSLQDPNFGPYVQKYLSEIQRSDILLYNAAKIAEHNI